MKTDKYGILYAALNRIAEWQTGEAADIAAEALLRVDTLTAEEERWKDNRDSW